MNIRVWIFSVSILASKFSGGVIVVVVTIPFLTKAVFYSQCHLTKKTS